MLCLIYMHDARGQRVHIYCIYISMRYILYLTLNLVNNPKPVQYEIYALAFPFDLRCQSFICISYNTGKSALPDVYARCPRANILHFRHSENLPKLDRNILASLYSSRCSL